MIRRLLLSYAVFASVVLVGLSACDRHIESKDPVRSLPAELPVPTGVTVQVNNRSVSLSWELTDSTGVDRFRVYSALASDSVFTRLDSTSEYRIELTRLPLNQVIGLRVTAVNASGTEGDPSQVVTAIAGLLSITIANGDEFTNSRDVQMQLNAPSTVDYVMLSEDSALTGAVVEPFQSQRLFTLSDGDGVKTVYARFIFSDGTESGVAVSDQITLDTYVRISSVNFMPVEAAFASGDTLQFSIDAGEEGGAAYVSFAGVSNLTLNDKGLDGDETASDGIYGRSYVIPFGVTVVDGAVDGHFTDAAGNQAEIVQAERLLQIRTAPLPVQVTSATALSSWEIDLRWSESSSQAFALYRVYRATTRTVSDTSELVSSIEGAGTTSWVDTSLAQNTKYFYRVYVVDLSGLSAASNVDSATTLANVAPGSVVVAVSLQDSTSARLSWTPSVDRDFASYRVYRNTSPNISVANSDLVSIITDQQTLSLTDFVPFPTGSETYYYRVFVLDRQGLSSSSNEVSVSQ
jgi:fibronectin type 3 domain-containing protein